MCSSTPPEGDRSGARHYHIISSRRTGPHQDSMPSFVVQSFQTSSTGAWKLRSIVIRRRAGWVCADTLGAGPIGPLEGCDVELAHLQQRFHDFRGVPGFRVRHHGSERGRDDLPGDAEAILQPAAGSLFAAIGGEARPDFIELFLCLARCYKRERLRELKGRSAIEGRVVLSVEHEAGV